MARPGPGARNPDGGIDPLESTHDDLPVIDTEAPTDIQAVSPDDDDTQLISTAPPDPGGSTWPPGSTEPTVPADPSVATSPAAGTGRLLAAACPTCRFVGEPNAVYCAHCGSSLTAPLEATPPTGLPKPRITELPSADVLPLEERQMTVGRCPACDHVVARALGTCVGCGEALAAPVVLVSINPDGSEGARHPPLCGLVAIGRGDADLPFADDAYLSPAHALMVVRPGQMRVEDLGSLNGTFHRLTRPVQVAAGDTFVVGRQLLRIEAAGATGAETVGPDGTRVLGSPPPDGRFVLVQLSVSGRVQDRYHLGARGGTIGREHGDVRFPLDRYVSGRHASLSVERDKAILSDLGSSNGTWVRIRRPTPLALGDELYLGSQVFRLTEP